MSLPAPEESRGFEAGPWLMGLLAGLLALGCGSAEPGPASPEPPSILLISIDTLRADHVSAYGYSRSTPHIDSLAAQGVVYEEAHSPAPWTLPAHASLLTGLRPYHHGLVDDDRTLPSDVPTLAELLTRRGYRCAAFVSHAYVSDGFGLDRGFGDAFVYQQYWNSGRPSTRNVLGDSTIDSAISYLREMQDDPRPFFLFVHLFDPHWPYAAPPPYAGRYGADYLGELTGQFDEIFRYVSRADESIAPEDLAHLVDLYDEEVAWTDHLVGRLVTAVRTEPRGNDAVIVLTSDHGEEFMEHGSLGHALTLYREQSHVPLIVSAPGRLAPGDRVGATVSTLDVAPTLLRLVGPGLAGLALGESDGRPLPEPGSAAAAEPARLLTMHTTRWGPGRLAAWKGDRKAIAPMSFAWGMWADDARREWLRGDTVTLPLEVYDLGGDPLEARPLPPDADDPALRALRGLQESLWRGIRIEVETPVPLQLGLRLPDPVEFRDEPSLSDGHVVTELPQSPEQRIGLGAAGRWTVRLPVAAGDGGPLRLRLDGAEEARLRLAGEERMLRAGEEVEIDLGAAAATGPLSGAPGRRPRIAVRARPWEGALRVPDLEASEREALEALGYANP